MNLWRMIMKKVICTITFFILLSSLPIIFCASSQGVNLSMPKTSQTSDILAKLFINEFMADNDRSVLSPRGLYSDWIELYNGSNETIDLSDMFLTNNLANPKGWRFPNGTLIESKAYLIIWAGTIARPEELNTNFALNANGGEIGLFDKKGENLIDSIIYEKQIRDVSYGRTPDGSSTWHHFTIPTPNAANVVNAQPDGTSAWTAVIVIGLIVLVSGIVIIASNLAGKKK